MTSITISQRLALTDFHSQELRLGEATMKGWELHDIVSDHSDQPSDPEETDEAAPDVSVCAG